MIHIYVYLMSCAVIPMAVGPGARCYTQYKAKRKRVVLKELTILIYSDSPVMEASVPASGVFFILTDNPSPPCGKW